MRATASVCSAAVVLAAAGCGDGAPSSAARPVARHAAASARKPLIVFRRVRYEGATLRVLTLSPDGTMKVDVPSGGAGGARFTGRVTAPTLRTVRREIARIPWRHLSRRKVRYDGSGAYFIIRHAGVEHTATADGMSADLIPLVDRLNGVLNGRGRAAYHTVKRFYTP